ncbi:dual specificity protein kinase zak2-like protein, partial [Tanacetum coccineum]
FDLLPWDCGAEATPSGKISTLIKPEPDVGTISAPAGIHLHHRVIISTTTHRGTNSECVNTQLQLSGVIIASMVLHNVGGFLLRRKVNISNGSVQVLDPKISSSCKQEAFGMLEIALQCTSVVPEKRPSMWEVVAALQSLGSKTRVPKNEVKINIICDGTVSSCYFLVYQNDKTLSFMHDFEHLKIPLKYIKVATNNFGDKPSGNGGIGYVYKGKLILQKGARTVAFKRLDRQFGQGNVEFWKEITLLSELKHKNLATLLRFCSDDQERILMYKYASSWNLDKYLNDASLTWTQLLVKQVKHMLRE